MKKLFFSTLILFIIGIVLLACRKTDAVNESSTSFDESAIAVKLASVQHDSFSLPIASSGLLSTEEEAKLSFKVGGIVSSMLAEEGQSVTKGQLLASLDLTEINAQVAQAQNNLEKIKRDLERGQRLHKDSAITLEQLQNLQTAFSIANESYTIASFNKKFATIHAPTSGKIIRKFVNEGEQINPGVPVFVINSAAQNNWIVKVGLPDIDWVRVKRRDAAKITFDAYPDIIFDGEVTLINEGSEPVTGLYLVEVKVKPAGIRLASGLFARVEIAASNTQILHSIPIEAVVEGNGKNAFVFVVNQDQKSVKKVPITIAYITDNRAIISKGLEHVKQIISSGSAFLTEFSTVQVAQQ